MPNYDFHALLEPLEFQELICDIVTARDDIRIERYKEGRDYGIDGFYSDGSKRIIIQAKRYYDYKKLYRDLKQIELPKIINLKPDKYILGASIDFTPKQKKEIMELLNSYIVCSGDILGKKDINNLLGEPKFYYIELKYTKLWLQSVNVFEKKLIETANRAVFIESKEELKEAIKASKVFAQTEIYSKALKKLSKNGVVIISGEPGVGKTTMAYILALAFLQPDNLNGFIWANSINDIHTMFDENKKQVIILDDFWGSIIHDGYKHKNDENRLEKLIKRIIEAKETKKLILTTREYVLQQGLQKHPALKEILERYGLVCTMEEYSDDEKASILFRHLYISNLEYEYVYYIYINYKWVIQHRNYNPRVLSLFIDKELDKSCHPKDYLEELLSYFDNPGTFWDSIFVDISKEAQMVVLLLLISSTPMRFEDMERCYQKYIQNCTNKIAVKNLSACIAELEKTMLKSFFGDEEETILLKFSMPAIQDFLFKYLQENSEQCIPQILLCCSFFNQLQFLFEHLSMYCSEKVMNLIIDQCIVHYGDYNFSCMEYDGSWEWDIDIDDTRDYLTKFFHLLRCCELKKHPKLYNFLEKQINNYCLTMGRGDTVAQYADLHNLPDIIVICTKKGMSFDGNYIIYQFYKEAFSVFHFKAMEQFKEIFPKEYAIFYNTYYQQIRKDLKNTILDEIELLDELDMELEYDMLIDSIPDILKEFGLRYTKKFEEDIFNLAGRIPHYIKKEKINYTKQTNDYLDVEEQVLEEVVEKAADWLLGPYETYIEEEEIKDIILKSSMDFMLKKELIKVAENLRPYYIYNLLQFNESINLIVNSLNILKNKNLPKREFDLYMEIIWSIAQEDKNLVGKLVGFCAESFTLFMYREEPILRLSQFTSCEIYDNYLKDDSQLCEIAYKYLIIKNEQWIRFINIPVFITCFLYVMYMGEIFENIDINFNEILGDNFNRLKYVSKYKQEYASEIVYYDFGIYNFRCYDWEECVYRIFEEIIPFKFNKFYVEPNIKNYLDKLGYGDYNSKVLNHISLCNVQVKYDKFGVLDSMCYEICDELFMINALAIATNWEEIIEDITKDKLKKLRLIPKVCKEEDNKYLILFGEINNIGLLKELGIFDRALNFIRTIENLYNNFDNGDYSPIKRLF